jgi:hypothetical protein
VGNMLALGVLVCAYSLDCNTIPEDGVQGNPVVQEGQRGSQKPRTVLIMRKAQFDNLNTV